MSAPWAGLTRVDDAARVALEAAGTSVEAVVERHREHLASACACGPGRYGVTGIRLSHGVVLMISEPLPGVVVITGHDPEEDRR